MCIGALVGTHVHGAVGGRNKPIERPGFKYPLCDLDL